MQVRGVIAIGRADLADAGSARVDIAWIHIDAIEMGLHRFHLATIRRTMRDKVQLPTTG